MKIRMLLLASVVAVGTTMVAAQIATAQNVQGRMGTGMMQGGAGAEPPDRGMMQGGMGGGSMCR